MQQNKNSRYVTKNTLQSNKNNEVILKICCNLNYFELIFMQMELIIRVINTKKQKFLWKKKIIPQNHWNNLWSYGCSKRTKLSLIYWAS